MYNAVEHIRVGFFLDLIDDRPLGQHLPMPSISLHSICLLDWISLSNDYAGSSDDFGEWSLKLIYRA